jgi:predicted alpha/beta hydrolase family esterase
MILPVPALSACPGHEADARARAHVDAGAEAEATVVVVPGLRDHVAEHWQTHLAESLTAAGRRVRTLAPLTEERFSRAAQVAALEAVVASTHGPVVLVAHSAGVVTTVHWAAGHRTDTVRGALLATPPDLDKPMHAPHPSREVLEANGWFPVPRAPLGFPSIVAASSDDPLADLGRVRGLAQDWGGRLVLLGPVGHLNPASGYGPWPQAEELLRELEEEVRAGG